MSHAMVILRICLKSSEYSDLKSVDEHYIVGRREGGGVAQHLWGDGEQS